jgi:DNA-binding transcriptional LysR family regulator
MGRLGRSVHVVRTIDETIEYVASGLGVAVVPHSVVAAHMPPTLVARPLRGARTTEFVAVWRPEDESLPKLRSLIRCVVRACQAILPDTVPADLDGAQPAEAVAPGYA